jgi:alkylated DNA repair protein (DNA oxidative demethylase)
MNPLNRKRVAAAVRPGAFYLPAFLTLDQQSEIAELCWTLGKGPVGFYQPVLRSGAKMRFQMMCLGMHWDARTYKYSFSRTDIDNRPVAPLPSILSELARDAAKEAGFKLQPQLALVNYYAGDGRLGLHQDKDEEKATLEQGVPVVSVSIGDDAEFLFGGSRRRDPVDVLRLHSGDAFVFGADARLCFHGVRRIVSGTGPADLRFAGRLNITMRQFSVPA